MKKIIFANKHSGSFNECVFHDVIETITCKLNCVEKYLDSDRCSAEMINEENSQNDENKLFIFMTEYINHARDISSLIDLKYFDIIFIAGGDGMVHEVVNGISNNNTYKKINMLLSVIPLGSGNHLSKSLSIHSIHEWKDSLALALDGMKRMKVFPTVVYTNNNKQLLSINTIIGGIPERINDTRTHISKYIPKFAGWLKYDVSTLYHIFSSFDNKITLHFDESTHSIRDIIGIFIQTTESCGSDLMISKNIKPNQENISLCYISKKGNFRLLYEFIKEKLGYESRHLVRVVDKYNVVYLEGSHLENITIDGQSEKIPIDSKTMIKKSSEYFNFICL
jgi:diacylglycerol kinase family enzyme